MATTEWRSDVAEGLKQVGLTVGSLAWIAAGVAGVVLVVMGFQTWIDGRIAAQVGPLQRQMELFDNRQQAYQSENRREFNAINRELGEIRQILEASRSGRQALTLPEHPPEDVF